MLTLTDIDDRSASDEFDPLIKMSPSLIALDDLVSLGIYYFLLWKDRQTTLKCKTVSLFLIKKVENNRTNCAFKWMFFQAFQLRLIYNSPMVIWVDIFPL